MKNKFTVVFGLFLSVFFASGCSTLHDGDILSTDGVKINFIDKGKGKPTLLFVHGFAGDISGWENQIDYFSKNYRVVAIDLPGFGDSGNHRDEWSMYAFGKDVNSVIKQLGLRKVIVIGHSMGSAVVVEAAIQNPKNIIGVVPCDVFHNVEEKVSDEFRKAVDNFYGESLNNKGWRESIEDFFYFKEERLTKALRDLKTPVICINSDRFTNYLNIARKYSSSFDIKIIEGVGHGVMVEAPEKFNMLLEEAIDEFTKNQ